LNLIDGKGLEAVLEIGTLQIAVAILLKSFFVWALNTRQHRVHC
jgi:hypothetical protein